MTQRGSGGLSRGPRDRLTRARTRGVGRSPGGRRALRLPGRLGARSATTPPGAAAGTVARRRPRLTARAAVLLLVLAALLASYASSLRAYVEQRQHVASLNARIESSRADIAALTREKKRWRDDAYVIAQARARFAFGFPGEIGYQVLDEDGRPLEPDDSLSQPPTPADEEPEWWQTTLDSVGTAGHPPAEPQPHVGPITTPPDLRAPRD